MPKSLVAPTVQPRVYPAGRAVLLYGVGAPELVGRRLVVDGRRVTALRFGRLALIVAYVDQVEFAPDEVERRRTSAAWLTGEARIHERVVERARAQASVVPARLLSAFAHPASLEEHAREQYARWGRALTRLGTKRECVVHLFAGPHAPPGGEPYLLRVTARSSRTVRALALTGDPRVTAHVQRVWRACAAVADATRRIQSPARRGALVSGTFLVSERGVERLRQSLEEVAPDGASLGVTSYLEGPRAPFSFV